MKGIGYFKGYAFLYSVSVFVLLTSMGKLSFSQDRISINYADSLMGKTINGEQVREANGNVSLTHNDVKIFCNKVLQYFDQNKAELYGNVKVLKDTMTIYAPTGIYYGNDSKVICPDGATLNDTKATLKANYGIYYFNSDMASFKGNVKIYDNKSYTITSDALDYFRSVSKSYAKGNVKIITDSSTIYSDSLVYEKLIGIATAMGNVKIESDSSIIYSDKLVNYENERKSIADDNVKIIFLSDNATIFGDHGENYERTHYAFVKGKTHLFQLENKKNSVQQDTLLIYSERMEAFRIKPEYYIGRDSVKVIRSDFLSNSQIAYYFKDISGTGGIITLSGSPVVWKDSLQVTGDSIYAYFKEQIDKIYVNKSAFALQQNSRFPGRYDQISGIFMLMTFKENQLEFIRVDTNAASIYFTYEDEEASGANRATGHIITLFFKDKQVEKVKIYGSPKGTYYPENMIKLEDLHLLGFRVRNDKPVRLSLQK
jgi:lipopolysaccharide export system protein LptA